MSAACPNRTRRKRLHPGGGSLRCPGRLVVAMQVAVVLPLVSPRAMSEPWAGLPAARRSHGLVVAPRALLEACHKADVRCSTCAWSLKASLSALRSKARRE